jgi:membrane-bound lytic murein transglycosylase D
MNYIASNKEKYGFEWAPQYFTIPDGVYEVPKNLYVEAFKKYVNVDDKAFHYYNRELRKNIIPKCFRLKLDSEAYKGLTVWIDSIYYYQDSVLLKPKVIEPEAPVIPEGAKEVVYTVKSGDVLGLIAEKYGVKVSEIQDWNNLTSTRIDIGDELIIYLDSNAVSIPDTSQNKVSKNTSANHKKIKINEKDNSKYVLYTVKPGDNLWLIAKKFPGISAQNIMDLNGIDENLKPGQVLRIKKK